MQGLGTRLGWGNFKHCLGMSTAHVQAKQQRKHSCQFYSLDGQGHLTFRLQLDNCQCHLEVMGVGGRRGRGRKGERGRGGEGEEGRERKGGGGREGEEGRERKEEGEGREGEEGRRGRKGGGGRKKGKEGRGRKGEERRIKGVFFFSSIHKY